MMKKIILLLMLSLINNYTYGRWPIFTSEDLTRASFWENFDLSLEEDSCPKIYYKNDTIVGDTIYVLEDFASLGCLRYRPIYVYTNLSDSIFAIHREHRDYCEKKDTTYYEIYDEKKFEVFCLVKEHKYSVLDSLERFTDDLLLPSSKYYLSMFYNEKGELKKRMWSIYCERVGRYFTKKQYLRDKANGSPYLYIYKYLLNEDELKSLNENF